MENYKERLKKQVQQTYIKLNHDKIRKDQKEYYNLKKEHYKNKNLNNYYVKKYLDNNNFNDLAHKKLGPLIIGWFYFDN